MPANGTACPPSKCANCKGCSVDKMKQDYADSSYSDGEPEELDLSELED